MIDVRVVSIGTLAANPLWGEREPARTGHATTTLVRAGRSAILVDPGLPEPAIAARLAERANLAPGDITHVFLTSFGADTIRGIGAFAHATWWITPEEREGVGVPLAMRLRDLATGEGHEDDDEAFDRPSLERALAVLRRCEPPPQTLLSDKGERVDVFPLPGVTPGLCGLLVAGRRLTTLICGDAVPTREHVEHGQVPSNAVDVAAARTSLAEALEIADVLIPGRDNTMLNPARGGGLAV